MVSRADIRRAGIFAATLLSVAVQLLLPAFAHADADERSPAHYTGLSISAPLDWHYVSGLDPDYSEAIYSVSTGLAHRYYPPEGLGVALEVSYLFPWARVVSTDSAEATTGRADHTSWSGLRAGASASARRDIGEFLPTAFPVFVHIDAGLRLTYYNREASNIFGERALQSSRIGVAVAARPGLILEIHDSFFVGVDVSLGADMVNRETVNRRYLENIAYNSFFRGVSVAPGVSAGVSF